SASSSCWMRWRRQPRTSASPPTWMPSAARPYPRRWARCSRPAPIPASCGRSWSNVRTGRPPSGWRCGRRRDDRPGRRRTGAAPAPSAADNDATAAAQDLDTERRRMTSAEIGVFGGSGFYSFLDDAEEVAVDTPYGPTSDRFVIGTIEGRRVAFLPRHGRNHSLPPHAIPYRANLWAMKELGVRRVIGPCASGSLSTQLPL